MCARRQDMDPERTDRSQALVSLPILPNFEFLNDTLTRMRRTELTDMNRIHTKTHRLELRRANPSCDCFVFETRQSDVWRKFRAYKRTAVFFEIASCPISQMRGNAERIP